MLIPPTQPPPPLFCCLHSICVVLWRNWKWEQALILHYLEDASPLGLISKLSDPRWQEVDECFLFGDMWFFMERDDETLFLPSSKVFFFATRVIILWLYQEKDLCQPPVMCPLLYVLFVWEESEVKHGRRLLDKKTKTSAHAERRLPPTYKRNH